MLTDQQESSLVSGGDCFEHWHSADRMRTHDDVLMLQSLTRPIAVSDDVVVDNRYDYLLVDTSAKSITITLPQALNGREIEVMKNHTANYLSIKTTLPDKILGENEIRVYNYGTALRFKAIPGGWFIV